MGDAKVKQQPFFGTQTHHHHHHHPPATHEQPICATTSNINGTATPTTVATMATTIIDTKHVTTGSPQTPGKEQISMVAGNNNSTSIAGKERNAAQVKYEQLKLRKQELEKRLNEKYSQLQQIKREEAQLIGMYPSDFSCGIGPSGASDGGVNGGSTSGAATNGNGTAPTLRRKIGTSFKLPENLLNNKEDDINKLLLEKQIQQQISEASLRLANDTGQPKSVRRTHKQNYEMAQQKLLAINQNLSVLKKRQQQKEQQQAKEQRQQLQQQSQQPVDHKPTARDDIDLHKTAQVNRFRSNSNSSSMLMHLSERRNSVKSNTSSHGSGSIAGGHHLLVHQHSHHQQQMLQVQIPGAHYHLSPQQTNAHSQQISPYSIHSGIIPSGSQSMTSAASAAMISQLSMLRHRARTDSFPGIAPGYDSASAGSGGTMDQSLKISPLSGSGSLASGSSVNNPSSSSTLGHHHAHHHHHQVGPGPARMNRLIQQQIGVNYSPPPNAPGSNNATPGYVISPTSVGASPGGSGPGQAFVYDAKVISRLQGGVSARSPPATSAYGHGVNDQNFCPNTMAAMGQSVSGGAGYDYGTHEITSSVPPAGLGGYWMTLDNGEKVWCSVDSRQFSSLDRKQQGGSIGGGSMKLSRTSTKLGTKPTQFASVVPAVKSASLGNFQEYIGKPPSLEDSDLMSVQPDTISVTSGSSEHKKREKVWRETSLDSPVVKHKALPPPVPTIVGGSQGQMSPSSIGSSGSHRMMPPQSPPYIPPSVNHLSTGPHAPLHINTNVSAYGGACSPLLLSPQQMRYYQQRQQQLLEQQRQRMKQQQQQQQQQQHQQQLQQQKRLMMDEQQKQQQTFPIASRQHESIATGPSTVGSSAYTYQHLQPDQQILPPYHSRHQHPPPPPLPPPNQHHYHHSQQVQNRLQQPSSSSLSAPQHLDLLPQSYSQPSPDGGVASSRHSPSSAHHRLGYAQPNHDPGYYSHPGYLGNTLSSRHPDLVISPTLSQASSHTLTSPSGASTTVVQALPVVGGLEENGLSASPTPSGKVPPSDIQMESPKNMTVVQQGKIMPYKEVTKPFEMSDFYKYSTKYRQKQQQQQQQPPPPNLAEGCPGPDDGEEANVAGPPGGDGIHKGIYQPPNRSICQPIVNNYN